MSLFAEAQWRRPAARHARTGGPAHAGRVVRAKLSTLVVLRRIELALLIAVGVPVVALVLPTALGGQAAWSAVVGRSMEPTIDAGDMVLTRAQADYSIGDVVVYKIPEGGAGSGVMIIHRIVGGSPTDGFVTAGDNRDFSDPWRPRTTDIIGLHWRTIPKGGYVIAWLRSPLVLGLGLSAVAYSFVLQLGASARWLYKARHSTLNT